MTVTDKILEKFLAELSEKSKPSEIKEFIKKEIVRPEWTFDDKKNWSDIKARKIAYDDLKLHVFDKDINISALKMLHRSGSLKKSGLLTGFEGLSAQIENFLKNEQKAKDYIKNLIGDKTTPPNINTIDSFINTLIKIAFKDKKGKSHGGASPALFVSVLLTSVFPDTFVDFRIRRWEEFAKNFGLKPPPETESYGEELLWAGDVAKQFANTDSFKKYFGEYTNSIHPNWIVAGLTWRWKKPRKKEEENEEWELLSEISEEFLGIEKEKSKEETDNNKNNQKIRAIINAIETKPFIILSGISGTGKTQIARIISAGIVNSDRKKLKYVYDILQDIIKPDTLIFKSQKADELIGTVEKHRIAFLPVRPDWNEAKKVFGYYNPLTGLYYPTDGLNVLLNAFRLLMAGEKDKKHFIILDEMNLARVEYYFSDILSLMENMWKRKDNKILKGETSQIHPFVRCLLSNIPSDVESEYVNKPEKKCPKTYEDCKNCPYGLLVGVKKEEWKNDRKMDKFIEEYNPIPPRIAYPENLAVIGTVNVDETTFSFAPKVLDRAFQLEFVDVHYNKYLEKIKDSEFYKFVDNLQTILKPKNMHFGYRVISEMLKYLENAKVDTNKKDNDTYDFLLKSKILPKLHGTEEQIGDIILQLLAFCQKGEKVDIPSDNKDEWTTKLLNETDFIYWDSAQKLKQMYQNMKATGYCSYF